MSEKPQQKSAKSIGSDLRDELIALLGDRLVAGEALISPAQFQEALEEGYQTLQGAVPSDSIKKELSAVLRQITKENPAVLMVPGIENWIVLNVLGQVRKVNWSLAEVQVEGQDFMRQFLRRDQVQAVLKQFELQSADLNIRNCMRSVVNAVAGKEDPIKKRAAARIAKARAGLGSGGTKPELDNNLDRLIEIPLTDPDPAEAQSRIEEEKKRQAKLRQGQLQDMMGKLDFYVKSGRISAEDAQRLQKLHRIDLGIRSGKVDPEKGSKVRNSILAGEARSRIEKTVREEVDYVVIYQQVFEALKRIDPKFDPALRFMIRHKQVVNALTKEEVEWKPILSELIEELDTLHRLIDIMDRQDAEVRMMAARLPPYNHVVRPGRERVDNLTIEEDFIDLLRQGTRHDLVDIFNSTDRKQRVLLAGAMLSINALITSLIKSTPFRKQIRILKIDLVIEEFFRSTEDVEEARQKIQDFLQTRIKSLYPDITAEEVAEIEEHSVEVIEVCQQRVLAERAQKTSEVSAKKEGSDNGDDDDKLREEEVKMGAMIGRVSMRIGGGTRLIPFKILPDSEEVGKWCLARRDPESNELVPVVRRGKKRYVEKNREGLWEEC